MCHMTPAQASVKYQEARAKMDTAWWAASGDAEARFQDPDFVAAKKAADEAWDERIEALRRTYGTRDGAA